MSTDSGYPNLPLSPPSPSLVPAGVSSPPVELSSYGDRGLSEPVRPALKLAPSALLRAFLRRWLIAILLGFLLGGATGAALWFLRPPLYTSYALLRIRAAPIELLPNAQNSMPSSELQIYQRTQVVLIKSRPNIILAFVNNPDIRNTETLRREPQPEEWLEKELQVAFLDGTDILRIALTGRIPEDLPQIVNAIKGAYLDAAEKHEHGRQIGLLKEIEKVLSFTENKIRDQRNALKSLAKMLQTSDSQALTLKQKNALEEYAALQREASGINARLREIQIKVLVVQGNTGTNDKAPLPDSLIEAELSRVPELSTALMEVMKKEELFLKAEEMVQPGSPHAKGQKNRYTADLARAKAAYEKLRAKHRKLAIDTVRDKVREASRHEIGQMQRELGVLQGQKKSLDEEVSKKAKDAENIGTRSFELEMKRKEIEQAENLISDLRRQRERLSAEILGAQKRVESVYEAEVPQASNMKSRLQLAIAGALGIFALSCGLISLLELRAQRIFSTDEVSQDLGMRVLGSLPTLPIQDGTTKPARVGEIDTTTLFIESIDGIRTMLLCDDSLSAHRRLMVTSARSGEGKTTLACHLAASIARTGYRTLLIDADFRKPALHLLFGAPPQIGLSELLSGQADISETIMPSPSPNLFILQAGTPKRETISLLGKDICRLTFEKLRNQFDFLIIDSSPVLPVADALMLGKNVDSIVMAVRRNVSQAPLVATAYERLTSLRIAVLGAVVIGENTRSNLYGELYPLLESETK